MRTFVAVAIVSISTVISACSSNSDPNDGVAVDELRALKTAEIAGTIDYGQTTAPLLFPAARSQYRAYRFTAAAHDDVDIWVRSTDGDARAWLLGQNFATLASNDDANSSTTDAHIVHTVAKAGTYYIAFREAKYKSASFTVQLSHAGAPSCSQSVTCQNRCGVLTDSCGNSVDCGGCSSGTCGGGGTANVCGEAPPPLPCGGCEANQVCCYDPLNGYDECYDACY